MHMLLEWVYQADVAVMMVVVGLVGKLFHIYSVWQMCAGGAEPVQGAVHNVCTGVHVRQQRHVGLVVCVCTGC